MIFTAAIIVCFILTVLLTPIIKKIAIKIGAVDWPNERKVHRKAMPRLGGLAIYCSFLIGVVIFLDDLTPILPILTGSFIIVTVGLLDDMMQLSAKVKFTGQLVAALVTVYQGIRIEFITLPFGERLEFDVFAIPITIIWIIAITNAINLIDGLDGLAAGISSIALLTISILAIVMGDSISALLGMMLLGSTLGFLVFNFYPARIFMGDTGSLFLGYMLSVLAIIGLYKHVTVSSLIVPIIILGIPIVDTTFAIIRRIIHKKPIMKPDKFHLHHSIIRLGFTHRQTVIILYMMSGLFSLAAVVFTKSTIWGAWIIIASLIILVELIVEWTGLISRSYRPILNLVNSNRFKKP